MPGIVRATAEASIGQDILSIIRRMIGGATEKGVDGVDGGLGAGGEVFDERNGGAQVAAGRDHVVVPVGVRSRSDN